MPRPEMRALAILTRGLPGVPLCALNAEGWPWPMFAVAVSEDGKEVLARWTVTKRKRLIRCLEWLETKRVIDRDGKLATLPRM